MGRNREEPDDQGWRGGPIIGNGNFMPSYVTGLDAETGQGPRSVVHYTTGCQAVDLEVDMITGQVTILRMAAAFDVGKAINPDQVRAQIKVNVDESPGVAARMGIRSIPTIMLFDQGELQEMVVGVRPRAEIDAMIDRAAEGDRAGQGAALATA